METKKKFYGWRNVVLLTIIGCVTVGFTVNCTSLYIVPVCESLGLQRTEFGVMNTVMNIVSFFAAMFLNKVFKLLKGGKRFMLCATLLAVIYQVLFTVASTKIVLYIAGAFLGGAVCYLTTAGTAAFITQWFVEKKSLAIGIVAAGTGIGGTVGNSLISPLITNYGWHKASMITTIIIAVVAIPCALFLADNPQKYGQVPLGYNPEKKMPTAAQKEENIQKKEFNPFIITACLA